MSEDDDGRRRVCALEMHKRGWLSSSSDSLQLRFATEADATKWQNKLSNAGEGGGDARMSSLGGGACRMCGWGCLGVWVCVLIHHIHICISEYARTHTDKYVYMFELIHTSMNTGMSARMSMAASGAATRPVLLNEREKLETEVLRQLLEYYFKIVRESITDSVPKAIMLKLVRAAAPVLWSPG